MKSISLSLFEKRKFLSGWKSRQRQIIATQQSIGRNEQTTIRRAGRAHLACQHIGLDCLRASTSVDPEREREGQHRVRTRVRAASLRGRH